MVVMRRANKVLIGVGGVLLSVIVALLIAIAFFNWNLLKPTINTKISNELGRQFAINGDLTVQWHDADDVSGWRSWIPRPHVIANDVTLSNPDWAQPAQMITMKRAALTLDLLPLLAQRIVIQQIQLTDSDGYLERLKDGRANWDFSFGNNPNDDNTASSSWRVELDKIVFDRGRITYRDEELRADLNIAIDSLGKAIPYAEVVKADLKGIDAGNPSEYFFGWKVEGRYENLPVHGEGKTGNVLGLRDTSRPFPVQADVAIGKTRIALSGSLLNPMHLGALNLHLAISGESMAELFPFTGVTLPDTPRYATDGHLVSSPGELGVPIYHYRNFNGRVGESDLHGSLTFTGGKPRPKLQGDLNSRQLRMVDLGPLIGVEPETKHKETRAEQDQVLPTQAFRTNRWRDMDADVIFSAEHIIYDERLPISNLDVHLVMDDGLLTLNPLRFGFVGGTISGEIKLNGRENEMTGLANISVRRLLIKELFPDVKVMQRALGQLNGDVVLTGVGNSVAALLGSGSGDLRLVVNNGVISKELMEIAGLNVGNYIVSKLFGDEEEKINCGVADMQMKRGLMTPRIFVFDTENAVVQITGDVNFKNETLNLEVSPESKGIRLLSLRTPLYVKGTFAHPDVGVELLPLAERGLGAVALGVLLTPVASLLALVAPSSDEAEQSCGSLIKQVQERGQK
jgi:uncharacterized protein involved in outer membrane biogenesis